MRLSVDKNLKFSIEKEVAVEDFSDISLLFLAEQLRVLKINGTTRSILGLMDGEKRIEEIIDKVSDKFKKSRDNIESEIVEFIGNMISEGVLFPNVKLKKNGEMSMGKSTRFLSNPDVSCRIEDEDGAILFNSDSDSAQIINQIGLDIWKSLEKHPRSLSEVISHIKSIYDNVPEDDVKRDVESFLTDLYSKGFIGEVVDE